MKRIIGIFSLLLTIALFTSCTKEADLDNPLQKTDTFEYNDKGVSIIMDWDEATTSFKGTFENTNIDPVKKVSVEIYLDNGNELMSERFQMASGEIVPFTVSAMGETFSIWSPDLEVD